MNASTRKFITRMLGLPTAPFHEDTVATTIMAFAARRELPCRRDRWGNLHLWLKQGTRARQLVLEAHMDHPGCELIAGSDRDWQARWLGGHDPRHFPGGRLLVHAADGTTVRGQATSSLRAHGHEVRFDLRLATPLAHGTRAFGMWDLTPATVRHGRFVTRAADDLAGCAVILATLDHLRWRGRACDLIACFTRAEEVGFLGASGLLADRSLPRRAPIIVLEASKELPGAVIGGGPVVRVGDRSRVYDPDVEAWLHETAQGLAHHHRDFRFQRQLMAGGTCEAGLYACHGHRATGIALALGNYHNLGKARPAAEEIGVDDVTHAITLCTHLAEHPFRVRTPSLVRHARQRFAQAHRRLQAT